MAQDKVIVFHPGTQHVHQTVLALQESGQLDRFLTGFYYKPEAASWLWLRLLPVTPHRRADAYLSRRRLAGIDDARVRQLPLSALLEFATERRLELRTQLLPVWRWNRKWAGRWAGQIVAARKPKAVLTFEGAACEVFHAARAAGVACVLDQSIGHLATALPLLQEEARLQPDFADSLEHQVPEWQLERARAEVRLADWILAPSDYVRESFGPLGIAPDRIVLIPYGVDAEQFSPRPEGVTPDKLRILFVGQVGQRKGIKYLLEAVRQLRLPDLELELIGHLVGSGNGLRQYAGLYHHTPHVPRSAIADHYRAADIFVLPSLHEGSALVIYEALASGLPVITTPNAGSVVRDGLDGFLVPIRNVDALCEKITLLYRDSALRVEMGRNARARALEYTWQRYGDRLSGWLRSL
jgi:glycosyltransferase involved in cell wall biosynthesis